MRKRRKAFLENPKHDSHLCLTYYFFVKTQSRNCVFIWIMSYYKSDFGADKSVRMVPRSQQEIFFQDATESLSVITSG